MPPLAAADSFEALGFEIEAESQNGRLIVSGIEKVSSSHSEDEIIESDDNDAQKSVLDDHDLVVEISQEEEEDDDVFYNAIDNAITTFTCGLVDEPCHSACKPLKSALRDPNSSGPEMDRNVSFNELKIREYEMTLGDHPSAITGPPVQLSWEHKPEMAVGLEEYERAREPRRNRRQLRLSYKERERVLFKERGFTPEEVNNAWMEALMVRKQRKETLSLTDAQRQMEEVWESTQRKIGRLFTLET